MTRTTLSWNRRTLMVRGASVVVGSAIAARAHADETDHKWTPAPGAEDDGIKALIDRAADALARGFGASDVLADGTFMTAHPYPRFRELVRAHAPVFETRMVPASEPGPLLEVRGTARRGGVAVANVEIYAYHTSAKGWYAADAAHVQADSGDVRHARLFAYVRTDAEGRYLLRTIRPAGYPETDLPAHIHIGLRSPTDATLRYGTEIRFEDDPRMTPAWRKRSEEERCVIVAVERGDDGIQRSVADFDVR